MFNSRLLMTPLLCGVLAFGVAACGDDEEEQGSTGGTNTTEQAEGGGDLAGSIRIDGSSTVFPFMEAAGELFNEENPNVKVTVGQSGTGGGFEKFCAGETDISNASRPIKDDEEVPICEKNGVKFGEAQVANDGIAVATNKNLQVDCLTTAQLKKLWNKGSKINSLSSSIRSFPTRGCRCTGPARIPARSTSSRTRSTVRKASRARTTRPPKTTTSS
jgi:phosphate transport system substrate-binding protein